MFIVETPLERAIRLFNNDAEATLNGSYRTAQVVSCSSNHTTPFWSVVVKARAPWKTESICGKSYVAHIFPGFHGNSELFAYTTNMYVCVEFNNFGIHSLCCIRCDIYHNLGLSVLTYFS